MSSPSVVEKLGSLSLRETRGCRMMREPSMLVRGEEEFSSRQLGIHHSHDLSVAAISNSVRVSEGLFVPSVISLAVPLVLMSLTRCLCL
ncbi:hypothetical protein E2542_SST22486 [Spatholobus suberectus]|nr:hypothetical protein E2542_SST22486 [Spatholobus suberectus]